MPGCNCNKRNTKRTNYNRSYRPIYRGQYGRNERNTYKTTQGSYNKYRKSEKYDRPYRNYRSNRGYRSRDPTNQLLDKYYERYNEAKYRNLNGKDLRSWDNIHRMAVNAITNELKVEFEKYIRYLGFNFPCPKCRYHIKQRMISHSIKNYYNIRDENGRDIGIAKWSWEFHNAVSQRLGKSTMSWSEFTKKYL